LLTPHNLAATLLRQRRVPLAYARESRIREAEQKWGASKTQNAG
jgi:hypothetical protein